MALCIIFMLGRIGSVVGSNVIGVLINVNCNSIFFIYGALLASKFNLSTFPSFFFIFNNFFLKIGCAALCFFLPKTSGSKD